MENFLYNDLNEHGEIWEFRRYCYEHRDVDEHDEQIAQKEWEEWVEATNAKREKEQE